MAEKENEEITGPSPTTIAWGLGVVLTIVSPFTMISAAITYTLYAWQRIKLSVLFLFGFLPLTIIVALFTKPIIELFITSWRETIPGLFTSFQFSGLIDLFLQQAPLGVPIGMLIGIAYATYKNKKRPAWEQIHYRLTPLEWLKKRRTIKNIKLDRRSPRDGMTLGIGERGERVVQTYEESTAHTLILGASGSGKTTTMKSRLRDALKSGQGAIIVDLKGDPQFAEEVYELATRYNHKFRHWLMQPLTEPYKGPAPEGPAYYDPISRGEATRRKDLLIESRHWTEDYYRIASASYLQIVMTVLIANPRENASTFSQLVELLDPHTLQERAIPLGSDSRYYDVVKFVDDLNDTKISQQTKQVVESLRQQFSELLMSVAGPWLQLDPNGNNNIDIKKAAHEGEVIFFTLDSSNYGGIASLVANLIIQDLKTVSSELRTDPAPQPFQVLVDEFQAIGSNNIIGLINRSRDAKLPVSLATQALGDLRQVSDSFLDQLVGIVGSFIIHRPNKADDAMIFAGLTGTTKRVRLTQGYSQTTGAAINSAQYTGSGMITEVEEPVVTAGEIQKLRTGEMIYVNKYKSPQRIERVQCIPEDSQLLQIESLQKEDKKTPKFPLPIKDVSPVSVPVPTGKPETISESPQIPTYVPNQPQVVPMSPATEETMAEPARPISSEPDLEKLSKIFSQDPQKLLGKSTPKPSVSELPIPSGEKPTLPTLPKLPPSSVEEQRKTPDSPAVRAPASKLPARLPPLPSTPVRPVSEPTTPINSKQDTKDEFDF